LRSIVNYSRKRLYTIEPRPPRQQPQQQKPKQQQQQQQKFEQPSGFGSSFGFNNFDDEFKRENSGRPTRQQQPQRQRQQQQQQQEQQSEVEEIVPGFGFASNFDFGRRTSKA
jgi:hypothetical protein